MEGAINHPKFPRAHVSDAAKRTFWEQVGQCVRQKEARAFKTCVKAYCNGKKKGKEGMPPKKIVRTEEEGVEMRD